MDSKGDSKGESRAGPIKNQSKFAAKNIKTSIVLIFATGANVT